MSKSRNYCFNNVLISLQNPPCVSVDLARTAVYVILLEVASYAIVEILAIKDKYAQSVGVVIPILSSSNAFRALFFHKQEPQV